MSEFHFIRPWCLLLLFALVAWCVYYFKKKPSAGQWAEVCDEALRAHILTTPQQSKTSLPFYAGIASVALAIVALAGPAWQKLPSPVYNETASLVIALDASLSMDAQDIKPSRMARAKLKVTDLLKQRHTGQTALLAYAAAPYVVSPLTSDTNTIMALVPSISTSIMPKQGSNTDLALEKAIALLDNANAKGDVLFISDEIHPSKAVMQKAIDKGIKVSVIGVGSTTGAPIPTPKGYIKDASGNLVLVKRNDVQLASLAKKTGGQYSVMTADNKDLNTTLNQRLLNSNTVAKTDLNVDLFKEQGPWLLLPALLIGLSYFRRGALPVLALFVIGLPTPSPVQAWELSSAFLNKNQQGAESFADEDYQRSGEQFENKEWKAAAQYRNNDFESALNTLEGINTENAHYNRGNAFFNLGQFDEAIKAYDKALALNPDFDDALYNKTVAEQAKKRKEQQQNEQNKQNSQEHNKAQNKENNKEKNKGQNNEQSSEQNKSQENNQKNKQGSNADKQNQQAQQPTSDKNESSQEALKNQADKAPHQNPTDKNKDGDEGEDKDEDKGNSDEQKPVKTASEKEIEQATKQWLRKIPDAPQNLLRNQFANEYQRNKHHSNTTAKETQPW